MSLVAEEEPPKRKLIEVRFYVTEREYAMLEEMAFYLYKKGALPKPSVNAFAKAAGFKMYKELAERIAKENEENAKQ